MAWYNPASWGKTKMRRFPAQRNYSGAGTGRLLAGFLGNSTSADSEIRPAIRKLRDRCRQLARNEPIAAKALQIFRTQVVGDKGLHLQVRARNIPRPGQLKGSLDMSGNDIVERAWKEWSQKGVCEISGRHSWIDCQQLVQESLVRDGEVLIKHIRNADNRFGYAIQFLEPDYLDEEYNIPAKNGNRVVMGVELNQYNKPVAYHLHGGAAHPYDTHGQTEGRVRIPAEDILHIYRPDRCQQTRGVPLFASVMDRIHQLNGYAEAELVAARLSASKSMFLKTQDGVGYSGDDFLDEAPIMDAGEPGSISQLPPGVDIVTPNMDHPNSAFADFHKAMLRSIASGLGLDYVTLSSNLESVSYSSIRAGTIESRDNYKMHQRFLIEHFANPVFREFLSLGITSGAIPFPSDKFDKFADAVVFRPRGYSWVDPQREVLAAVNGLQNGFLTFSDVAQQIGGRDVEETFSTLQADLEMADRYGLKINLMPLGLKSAAKPEIDKGEENGTDE
jgi:lambda family phage portal protein